MALSPSVSRNFSLLSFPVCFASPTTLLLVSTIHRAPGDDLPLLGLLPLEFQGYSSFIVSLRRPYLLVLSGLMSTAAWPPARPDSGLLHLLLPPASPLDGIGSLLLIDIDLIIPTSESHCKSAPSTVENPHSDLCHGRSVLSCELAFWRQAVPPFIFRNTWIQSNRRPCVNSRGLGR